MTNDKAGELLPTRRPVVMGLYMQRHDNTARMSYGLQIGVEITANRRPHCRRQLSGQASGTLFILPRRITRT